jgi:hypothetical protein
VSLGDHRLVVMDFTHPASKPGERVRVYIIPAGRRIYRLVCRTALTAFDRYVPVFAHVAATFVARPVS